MRTLTKLPAEDGAVPRPGYQQMALLLALGWALTNIAYAIYDLPLKFVLKDELHRRNVLKRLRRRGRRNHIREQARQRSSR